MAAQIIDDDIIENESAEQAQEPEEALQGQPQEPEQQDEELPEKYRGKTMADVVRMHQEAEKVLGRQANEVGDLRKVVDQYITAQLSQGNQSQQTVQQEPQETVDWFEDPDKAFEQRIESHPAIRQAREQAVQAQKETALTRLKRDHPDMETILQDTKFAEWVGASNVRKKLFYQADQEYDYEAAHELFSLWKDRRQLAQETVQAEEQTRKQKTKQAATGSQRAAASDGQGSKKVYRRVDIINLMKKDPARYEALEDEILRAYSEGRVR